MVWGVDGAVRVGGIQLKDQTIHVSWSPRRWRLPQSTVRQQIWFRAGNAHQYQALNSLVRLNDNGHYHEVIERSREILAEAPLLAEAWNQQAIAEFSLFEYEESALNCQRALEINPYHYNAAMGLGHCYLQMDQPILALEAFRGALKTNPNLECVRSQIRQLERSMGRERLDD